MIVHYSVNSCSFQNGPLLFSKRIVSEKSFSDKGVIVCPAVKRDDKLMSVSYLNPV